METSSRQSLLIETGLDIASELSLPEVLRRILRGAVAVTGARYGAIAVLGPDGRIVEFITSGVSRSRRRAIGSPPTGGGLLGAIAANGQPLRIPDIRRDPRSAGFPPKHPPMTTFLGTAVRARGEVFGNIYVTDKTTGGEFTDTDAADLAVLAAQAGVAVANALLYDEIRRRERWADAMRRTTLAILSGTPLGEVWRLVCHAARELAGADLAMVMTAGAGSRLDVVAADGPRSPRVVGRTVPADRSLAGVVMRTGAVVAVDDARADARAHRPSVRLGGFGPCVFAPLAVGGHAFGALHVSSRVGARPFADAAAGTIEAFAAQASVAFGYDRARHDAQRVAGLAERERVAQELHDDVAQALFGVSIGLQGMTRRVQGTEVADELRRAVDRIERVVLDLRAHIFAPRSFS